MKVQQDQKTYPLAIASAIGSGASLPAVGPIVGGSYIWSLIATFGGATIKLQALGPDAATWLDVASMVANGSTGVVLGDNAQVRLTATGAAAAAVSSSLS